jgi:hypothetical protein
VGAIEKRRRRRETDRRARRSFELVDRRAVDARRRGDEPVDRHDGISHDGSEYFWSSSTVVADPSRVDLLLREREHV